MLKRLALKIAWSLPSISVCFLLNTCPYVGSACAEQPAAEAADSKLIRALADSRLIDLTHPFDEQTIYWPTEKGFLFQKGSAGVTAKGYFYAANRFAAAEHGGTHLDSPIHFFKDHRTVDQIPLEQLADEGVVIDVTLKCNDNPDYEITIADLHDWETAHRRQLMDVIVLLRTGYGKRWPDRLRYLGTEATGPGAVEELHFPGLHPDAAHWLAAERRIKAIGIDTASIDYGQSTHFQSHVRLCERQIPIFENVAHLDQLPEQGFVIIALPMKIAGGSGAPLRIIAAASK